MAVTKLTYANQATITITTNLLASSATAGRESTVVDNTTNLYLDALLSVDINCPAGTPGNDKAVYIWGYGWDGASNYTGGVTGSDAAYTRLEPTVLKLIGVVPCPNATVWYHGGPFSVANAFGGVLPAKWGIVVQNYTGNPLATTSNFAFYTGVTATTA